MPRKHGGPWTGFTTEWYARLLDSPDKIDAAKNTVVLGVISTVIATVFGTMLGYGLSRYSFPGKKLFSWLMYVPVVIPDIVMAVAMLSFFAVVRDWLNSVRAGHDDHDHRPHHVPDPVCGDRRALPHGRDGPGHRGSGARPGREHVADVLERDLPADGPRRAGGRHARFYIEPG